VRSFLIREFFRGEAVDALGARQPLVTSGLLDSVATLKLVLFLEEHFHVTIDSADIADGQLDTLESIELLIQNKQGDATPR
jgi:acyl carrier protein